MKAFCFSLVLLCTGIVFAQPAKMKVALDSYLQRYHEIRQLSGVVLISMQGQVMYKNSLGWVDPKTNETLTGQEKFGIGSTTKLLTAILIMQQVETGILRLDDPISKFLPETKIPNSGQITIKQLLQHTSGLGNYMSHPMYGKLMMFGKIKSIDDLLPLIEEMPAPKAAPGSAFQYSNSGYILLGKILEKVTKKTYRQLLEQRVLKPLNLKNSFTEITSKNPSLAQPYRFLDDQHYIHFPNPDTMRCFPDGGLFMTADDLSHLGNAILNNQLVKPATFQQMITDSVRTDRQGEWYGLGVTMEKIGENIWIGHDGFSRGYSVDLKLIPSEKGVLVSMFNNNAVSSVQINKSIIGMMDGKEPAPPKMYLWKVLHELTKKMPRLTLVEVNAALKEKGYSPLTSPMQILNTTNDLFEAGLADVTLELLQFNLSLFPKETVSYKALGETYADLKNQPKAIEYFKQALKINPNDEFANRRLKELSALK